MKELKKNNLKALLVTSSANITYLMGFVVRDAYLLVTQNKNYYLTDSRYSGQLKKKLKKNAALIIIKDNILNEVV